MGLERVVRDQREWAERWPGYCRACNGWGGKVLKFDPSPAGVSLSAGYLEEFETCDECQCGDEVRCPRCGKVIEDWEQFQSDEAPCPHCGWAWGMGKDDVMPWSDEDV